LIQYFFNSRTHIQSIIAIKKKKIKILDWSFYNYNIYLTLFFYNFLFVLSTQFLCLYIIKFVSMLAAHICSIYCNDEFFLFDLCCFVVQIYICLFGINIEKDLNFAIDWFVYEHSERNISDCWFIFILFNFVYFNFICVDIDVCVDWFSL
jgi:hypothetical protein